MAVDVVHFSVGETHQNEVDNQHVDAETEAQEATRQRVPETPAHGEYDSTDGGTHSVFYRRHVVVPDAAKQYETRIH